MGCEIFFVLHFGTTLHYTLIMHCIHLFVEFCSYFRKGSQVGCGYSRCGYGNQGSKANADALSRTPSATMCVVTTPATLPENGNNDMLTTKISEIQAPFPVSYLQVHQ